MKKLALIFMLLFCIVFSCTNDDKMPAKVNVQFSVAITAKSSAGARIAADTLPGGAYVLLSITTSTGYAVYSFNKTELIKLGDGYITEPLALVPGDYLLTDFFVMASDNSVLYVAPKADSELAAVVSNPLPKHFNVTKDGITNLDVEVVSTTAQLPQDFGYASFDIKVAGGDFSISLFAIQDNKPVLLSGGNVTIYHNNQLVYSQTLDHNLNLINYKGDPDEQYVLFVQATGYTIKRKEYVLRDLLAGLNGKPLTFILEPALTMNTIHHAIFDVNLPFSYNLVITDVPNTHYKLAVDWGDGTVDPIEGTTDVNGFASLFILHFYADSLVGRPDYMNITGELSKVNFFYFVNPIPLSVKTIDLRQTTNINGLVWMVVQSKDDTPSEMDLSGLTKLTTLYLLNTAIKNLDITSNPLLDQIDVENTNFSDEALNTLVYNLYNNVQAHNLENGRFFFSNLDALTPESHAALISLRDQYGWTIYPNP